MRAILPTRLVQLILGSFFALGGLIQAEDLTTADGQSYKGIKILNEEPERIKVLHSNGISFISKKVLPAEFVQAHELAAAPSNPAEDEKLASKKLLTDFVAKYPEFKTRDGTAYKSSEIIEVEPSGLKLMTSTGIARVKFIDLSEKYKTAFAYDPDKAAEFEGQMEAKRQTDAAMREKLANAASVVDGGSGTFRLLLLQNVGKCWVCNATLLSKFDQDVVTSRLGASLTGPAIVYESRKQEVTAEADFGEVVVFGLPSYNSTNRTWQGKLYFSGRCQLSNMSGSHENHPAFNTSRDVALKLVAEAQVGDYLDVNGGITPATSESKILSSSGTVFAISTNGHLATAAHVVEGATEIKVYVNKKPLLAKVLAMDTRNDVAIVKIEAPTVPIAIMPAERLGMGDGLFTIGFPLTYDLGKDAKFTEGSVTSLGSEILGGRMAFQMSVPIQPGNSGGPVCTSDGEVVGIVRSTYARPDSRGVMPQNVNFATRTEALIKLAKSVPDLQLLDKPLPDHGKQAVLQSTYYVAVKSKA